MEINELPEAYKTIVLKLFSETTMKRDDINLLFELHNKIVNPTNKENGRACGSCVKRVATKVREAFIESYQALTPIITPSI